LNTKIISQGRKAFPNIKDITLYNILSNTENPLLANESFNTKLINGFIGFLTQIDTKSNLILSSLYLNDPNGILQKIHHYLSLSIKKMNINKLIEERNSMVLNLERISSETIELIKELSAIESDEYTDALYMMLLRGHVKRNIDLYTNKFDKSAREILNKLSKKLNELISKYSINISTSSSVPSFEKPISAYDLIWKIQNTPSSFGQPTPFKVLNSCMKIIKDRCPELNQVSSQIFHSVFLNAHRNQLLPLIVNDLIDFNRFGSSSFVSKSKKTKIQATLLTSINNNLNRYIDTIIKDLRLGFQTNKTKFQSDKIIRSKKIKSVMVLGDSLTSGERIDSDLSFASMLGEFLNIPVHKLSWPGTMAHKFITEGMLAQWLIPAEYKNTFVIIQLGLNDIGLGRTPEELKADFKIIIDHVRQNGATEVALLGFSRQPIFNTIMYEKMFQTLSKEEQILLVPNMLKHVLFTERFYTPEKKDESIKDESSIIRTEANPKNYIEPGKYQKLTRIKMIKKPYQMEALEKKQKNDRKEYVSKMMKAQKEKPDFLHPNKLGHLLMATNIFNSLEAIFKKLGIYQPL